MKCEFVLSFRNLRSNPPKRVFRLSQNQHGHLIHLKQSHIFPKMTMIGKHNNVTSYDKFTLKR